MRVFLVLRIARLGWRWGVCVCDILPQMEDVTFYNVNSVALDARNNQWDGGVARRGAVNSFQVKVEWG